MTELHTIRPEWLTVTDAAIYSGLSTWTVRDNLRNSRWIGRKAGKRVLVNRASIDAAIDALPPAVYAPLPSRVKSTEGAR